MPINPLLNTPGNQLSDNFLSAVDAFQKQKGYLQDFVNYSQGQSSTNPFEQEWMNTNFNDMVASGSANSAYYNMMMADPNSQYWSPYLEKYLDNAIARENTADARAWEEKMSNTAVQRSMADLKAAGLNPWLAISQPSSSSGVASASSNMSDASTAQRTSQQRDMLYQSQVFQNYINSGKAVAETFINSIGRAIGLLF